MIFKHFNGFLILLLGSQRTHTGVFLYLYFYLEGVGAMKKLSHRIIVMSIVICFILETTLATTAIINIVKTNKNHLSKIDEILRNEYDEKAKLQVEIAVSMLTEISKMEERGDLSHQEALKLGADLLRQLRYDKEGYFWADTPEGINVVLPGSETEGTNRYNSKDAKRELFIQEIIKNRMKKVEVFLNGGFLKWVKENRLPREDTACYSSLSIG